jgi:hypothetical protein
MPVVEHVIQRWNGSKLVCQVWGLHASVYGYSIQHSLNSFVQTSQPEKPVQVAGTYSAAVWLVRCLASNLKGSGIALVVSCPERFDDIMIDGLDTETCEAEQSVSTNSCG